MAIVLVTLFITLVCDRSEAAKDKPVVWKLASFHPPGGGDGLAYQWFAREVEARSRGRLKIKIYWSEQLANAKEMLESVKSGVADIAFSCSPYFPGKVPLSTLGFVPFTNLSRFDQMGIAWNYLAENPLLIKEFDQWNARYLFSIPNGPFNLMSKKPLKTIDDLKGLKIRTIGDQSTLFKPMGAVPVSITAPDAYMALERGLCDAVAGCGDFFYYDFRIYEACKNGYFVNDMDFSVAVSFWLVNKDSYNALPRDIQEILESLQWETAGLFQEILSAPEADNAYRDKFKEMGINIINFPPEERKKMLPFAKPIWDAWKERNKAAGGPAFFDAYMKANERVLKEYPNGIYRERPLPSWISKVLPK